MAVDNSLLKVVIPLFSFSQLKVYSTAYGIDWALALAFSGFPPPIRTLDYLRS